MGHAGWSANSPSFQPVGSCPPFTMPMSRSRGSPARCEVRVEPAGGMIGFTVAGCMRIALRASRPPSRPRSAPVACRANEPGEGRVVLMRLPSGLHGVAGGGPDRDSVREWAVPVFSSFVVFPRRPCRPPHEVARRGLTTPGRAVSAKRVAGDGLPTTRSPTDREMAPVVMADVTSGPGLPRLPRADPFQGVRAGPRRCPARSSCSVVVAK